MRLTLDEVAAATGGRTDAGSTVVDGAGIDSRSLPAGSLFVALRAERDGHDFLPAAATAGAAAALVDDPSRVGDGLPHVEVEDTAAALTNLGRSARDRLGDQVVGITGSVGKTSVKDLLAAAIGADRSVHASERSFNNELGCPLTLLNAPDEVDAVVVEMGARGIGHVAELCSVARPTVGVVTAVAAAHTELFGGLDQVAQAKGELVEALPVSGTAVLNADDPRVAAMAERSSARVLTYGRSAGAVRVEDLSLDGELRPSFDLLTPWGRAAVSLEARGAHNAANAAGAAAAALALDVPLDAVVEGLQGAVLSPWRMELCRTAAGALVINDAYNANPASVRAAIDALAAAGSGRRIAVLGVMAELGESSRDEHRRIGEEVTDAGIELIAVAAPEYGGIPVADAAEAQGAIGDLRAGDAVLIKGSRVAGLESLAETLCDRGGSAPG